MRQSIFIYTRRLLRASILYLDYYGFRAYIQYSSILNSPNSPGIIEQHLSQTDA